MNIKSHSFEDIWIKINAGAKIFDVRTPQEYQEGHLQGARNIPHDLLEAQLSSLEADKEKDLILYCKSGARSDFAMKLLHEHGFKAASNAGSYVELLQNRS